MLREEFRTGLAYLEEVTALLQRVRSAHPTAGLYEAADLQWWWGTPRATDDLPQLFWFDQSDRPVAAVVATAWKNTTALDPLFMPDPSPDWVAHVIGRGLAHAAERGLDTVELEVDTSDEVVQEVLTGHGFSATDDDFVESWLWADNRPGISPLPNGYRLRTRLDTLDRPHHMIGRNHPRVEERLRQTSLYRPDLDLVVHDAESDVAGYGMFWYDPVTSTGLVEPMRTEDAHQRRGIARHILTTGVDLLARAGATRIKIAYEPTNPASGHLYRSVGFEPDRETVLYSGAVSS